MDTWFVILLLGAVILLAAGPIVWASAILRSGGCVPGWCDDPDDDGQAHAPPERVTRHLDSNLAQLDRLILSVCKRSEGPGAAHRSRRTISPYRQLRIQNIFMETHAGLRRLDDESRRRYETRVADLSTRAASAGIYWSPETR